jgi:hypothetical protein
VVLARSIQVVHPQCVPLEVRLQLGQGLRLDSFVDLNRAKQSALSKIAPQMVHDSSYRRLCTPQIQSADGIQRMPPGRCDEDNQQAAGCYADLGEPKDVVHVQDLDRQIQEGKVLTCQLEDTGIQLETQSLRARQVAQQPVKGISGAGKRIHHDAVCAVQRYGGDILTDRAAKRIASTLNGRAAQQADATRIPLRRL